MIVLIVLHNEYDPALWHHSIVWRLFRDKQTSKSHKTSVAYEAYEPLQFGAYKIYWRNFLSSESDDGLLWLSRQNIFVKSRRITWLQGVINLENATMCFNIGLHNYQVAGCLSASSRCKCCILLHNVITSLQCGYC